LINSGGVLTSAPLGSQARHGTTLGVVFGIFLRWRSLSFPMGMKAPLQIKADNSGAQVGTVVTSPPPGLALPKAKARATSTSASVASALVGAVVFSH